MTHGDVSAVSAAPLQRAHQAGLSALRARHPGVVPARLPGAMRTLERISLGAITAVLASSGALWPGGPARSPGQIMEALAVAPRHLWLVRRWLAALVDEGAVVPSGDGRRFSLAGPVAANEPSGLDDAYADLGFPPVMPAFHRTALGRLAELLRDEVTVRHLLFPDGDALTALAGYQTSAVGAYANAGAGHVVRETADRVLARPPRIVELGGGAGVCTAAVSDALLGADADYLFTDVSRLFTVAARERHGARLPGLRCAVLDIDEDFAGQGLPPGSADVVLAGNVLHNAADAGASLRRVRALLAPGGRLVFTESVCETRAILTSIAFLLSPEPGRPRVGSGDRRRETGEAFLDAGAWDEELSAAGLTPRGSLPGPGSPLAAVGQRLFVADAPGAGAP